MEKQLIDSIETAILLGFEVVFSRREIVGHTVVKLKRADDRFEASHVISEGHWPYASAIISHLISKAPTKP